MILKPLEPASHFPVKINLRTVILRFGIAIVGTKPVDLPCGSVTAEQLITWSQFEDANFDIIKATEDRVMSSIREALVLLSYEDGPYVN